MMFAASPCSGPSSSPACSGLPLNELAPRVVPFPDGGVHWVITLIEIWLLFLIPVGDRVHRGVLHPGLVPLPRFHDPARLRSRHRHRYGDGRPRPLDCLARPLRPHPPQARGADSHRHRPRGIRLRHRCSPRHAPTRRVGRESHAASAHGPPRALVPPPLRATSPPARCRYEARRILGENFSMLVFDGLIDIIADRELASRVRQGLIGGVPPRGLWLTQSEEARELERLIRTDGADLHDIPRRIAEVEASLEEWRILSWEYLRIAHRTRARSLRRALPPGAVAGGQAQPLSATSPSTASPLTFASPIAPRSARGTPAAHRHVIHVLCPQERHQFVPRDELPAHVLSHQLPVPNQQQRRRSQQPAAPSAMRTLVRPAQSSTRGSSLPTMPPPLRTRTPPTYRSGRRRQSTPPRAGPATPARLPLSARSRACPAAPAGR